MRRSGKLLSVALAVLWAGVELAWAGPAMERIEVRLVARQDGYPLSFADGTTFDLERLPLLQRRHFARAEARPTPNLNNPGLWRVEVVHNASGRAAFVAAGEAGRDRTYCVVIGRTIDNCAAFPPPQKGLYERGQILMDRSEAEARGLAARINAAIEGLASDERRADRASRQGPRQLLEALYGRAVKEQSPAWLDGEERATFLSRELVALWAKADAAQAAGNHDALLDYDPVAATNGLELKGYRIAIEQRRAGRARARVALTYKDSSDRGSVAYELVEEDGHWRIAEIGEGENSVGAALRSFIAPPDPAGR